MNKVGIHYGFWSHNWNVDYDALIEKVSRLGFDVLEVASASFVNFSKERLKDLKKRADDHNISFTYSVGLEKEYDLASDDEAVRRNGIEHVKRIFDTMPIVDAHIFNGVSYAGWQCMPTMGIDMDEKKRKEDIALASVKELMKTAEDNNVIYCFEVVNRFEQYLMNTAEEGVAFAKRVDHPNAKVLLDTFHMNIEEDDMITPIKQTGEYLGHFHIGENNRKTPGTGKLPWAEMIAALKEIHYEGAIVMEPFMLMGGEIAYDIKVWRDISRGASEHDMDILAQNACKFIKDLLAK